jgi:SAM-dependent methyltransferase
MTTAPRDDVLYPTNFYAYQAPVHIDYAASLNGIAPPVPPGAPFTYLDLGCGDGFTIVLLAAMHPEARFLGVDFSPGHVELGRRLAAAGGIGNVELIAGDFRDWRALDLPACDYIALHGVYSWIGDGGRAAVVEIARERLQPAGLLYCGYNALPGWAAMLPIRHYFTEYLRGMGPDTTANVGAALRHLLELKAKGAEFFRRHPTAGAFLDDMAKVDPRYVVHEIFPPEWSPLAFSTVLGQMREAGLEFAASGDLVNNLRRLAVRPELLPGFLREPAFERAELVRDYANNTAFRRDIFRRPAADAARRPFEELAVRPFGAKVPAPEIARTLALPWGRIQLEAERFEAMRRAFAGGTRTLPELAGEPALARLPLPELAETLQALTFGLEVAPFLRAAQAPLSPPVDWTVPLLLNRHLLAEPAGPPNFAFLAAPAAGAAAALGRHEALLLLAVAEAGREGAADWSWRFAREHGRWLVHKGVAAKDRARHRAACADILAGLGPRLAKWVELGIIEAR